MKEQTDKERPHFPLPINIPVERFGSNETGTIQSLDFSRVVTEEDIDTVVRICQSEPNYSLLFKDLPLWAERDIPEPKYTKEDAAFWLKNAQEKWSDGSAFVFLIRNPENEIVGAMDIKTTDLEGGEVGYWADPRVAGYMTNAVKRLLEVARGAGYRKLFGLTLPINDKSQGVLERAGFSKVGEVVDDESKKKYIRFELGL